MRKLGIPIKALLLYMSGKVEHFRIARQIVIRVTKCSMVLTYNIQTPGTLVLNRHYMYVKFNPC